MTNENLSGQVILTIAKIVGETAQILRSLCGEQIRFVNGCGAG